MKARWWSFCLGTSRPHRDGRPRSPCKTFKPRHLSCDPNWWPRVENLNLPDPGDYEWKKFVAGSGIRTLDLPTHVFWPQWVPLWWFPFDDSLIMVPWIWHHHVLLFQPLLGPTWVATDLQGTVCWERSPAFKFWHEPELPRSCTSQVLALPRPSRLC